MKNKLFLFLTFVLSVFFLATINVHADGEHEDGWFVEDVKYDTFQDAYKEAKSTKLISLYGDATVDLASTTSGFKLDVVNGTLTFDGTFYNQGVTYLYSSGEGSYVWDATVTFLRSNITITICSGTHYNFSDEVSASSAYYSITGGTFIGLTTAAKSKFTAKVKRGYAPDFTETDDTYTATIISKAEEVAKTAKTLSSLKATYTQGEGYWEKVSDASTLSDGDTVLVAYVDSYNDAVVIMNNYGNVSTKNMYCGSNKQMTDNGSVKKANLSDVEVLSYKSFRIGDDLKHYSFIYKKESSKGYLAVPDSGNPLVNYSEGSVDRMLSVSYSYETAISNAYNYLVSVTDYGVFFEKKQIAYGVKVASNYTQGRAYVGSTNDLSDSNLGDLTQNKKMYLFSYHEGDYETSSMAIRFGAGLTYTDVYYASQYSGTITYGVIAGKLNTIVGDLTIENATYKQECTPVCVAAIGDSEKDPNGGYYQFALVLEGIDAKNYSTEILARAYVCVDGTYYYYETARYSVKSLAQAYLDQADTSAYEDHLDYLKSLAN